MARVTLDRVGFDRGDRKILDDVTLDVLDGEFFCVVGPSGCGKTTLLRLLAGLEKPSRGSIYFDGRDVTHVQPVDRDVAMVFQDYQLYPHMSAAENIGFALQFSRKQDEQTRQKVVSTAEELSARLVELLDSMPDELSAGFRQRVALARAVVRHPRVFLLDEPLSTHDTNVSTEARSHMRRFLRGLESTTIYATADDREAFALADRVAVMSAGRVEQVSTPQGVWAWPVNRFVAEFVHEGMINLYPARIDHGAERVVADAFSLPATPGISARLSRSEDFVLGLLPTQVRIEAPSEECALVGSVELVEPLIAQRKKKVHVERVGGFRCVAEVGMDVGVRVGEAVGVSFDLERALLFDAVSGRTIS
jgi:multiple sugar transport system ATP-binding protein